MKKPCKWGLLLQREMHKYTLQKCKVKAVSLVAEGFRCVHETLNQFPFSETRRYETSVQHKQRVSKHQHLTWTAAVRERIAVRDLHLAHRTKLFNKL